MPRGAVIITENGRVALIERVRQGEVYFLFPGGQREDGETLEETAIREAYEELGLHVRIGPLAATVDFPARSGGRTQSYFWAQVVDGAFGSGDGEELKSNLFSPKGRYRPVWLRLDDFPNHDVRPRALAEALYSKTISPGAEVLRIVE